MFIEEQRRLYSELIPIPYGHCQICVDSQWRNSRIFSVRLLDGSCPQTEICIQFDDGTYLGLHRSLTLDHYTNIIYDPSEMIEYEHTSIRYYHYL